jgi:hypothetical protein
MTVQTRMGLGLIVAAVVLATVLTAVELKENHDRTERYRDGIRLLRLQYPLEDLEPRLPAPPRHSGQLPLSPLAAEHLRSFEDATESATDERNRERRLQKLHEGSVEEFVRQEGFGAARMFGGYAESVLAQGYWADDRTWIGRNRTSVPQPGRECPPLSAGFAAGSDRPRIDHPKLLPFHTRNVVHFANPGGFGYVRDRRQVAGFQPHQFNELLKERPWAIRRLELVGVLSADQPRVFVTPDLPRMQDVRGAPTRSPDAFEVAGLARLYAGDELYVSGPADDMRMVGAIRNARQCIQCHGGDRGDLLGAFSYHLVRVP